MFWYCIGFNTQGDLLIEIAASLSELSLSIAFPTFGG